MSKQGEDVVTIGRRPLLKRVGRHAAVSLGVFLLRANTHVADGARPQKGGRQ